MSYRAYVRIASGPGEIKCKFATGLRGIPSIFASQEKRMRSLFSILPVTIAVLLLTLFPMVPHHHPGGGESIVMEMETAGHGSDEQHPVPGIPLENPEHAGACIVNVRYVLPSQVLQDLYGMENGGDLRHLHCFTLPAPPLSFTPEFISSGTLYNTGIFLYLSAPSGLCYGLRAPPYCTA